ncbi:MAG: acetyl-CoA carboxylase, carboxyltransferase subunit beta [Chlorobiota bacterium]|jgi:acetyl-CoA carboxylase carboxyl transferase subunit beta
MAWFKRSEKNIKSEEHRNMPDGLWTKAPNGNVIYKKELEENLYTDPNSDHHFRVGSKEYIEILFDEGTFKETHKKVKSADPLEFEDTKKYTDRLAAAHKKTDSKDALTTGYGKINGHKVSFGCMNFDFVGGSMGSVVGEKFVRAANYAIKNKCPLIIISTSGGARMQEAVISLMQMAKTSVALAQLEEAGLPFISILTDPTTGGVSASFAMLGDVIISEPGALIGFAGPRVVEQTIKRKLPEGFQRAEFLLEHGFVDMIVHRKNMKEELTKIISWFGH